MGQFSHLGDVDGLNVMALPITTKSKRWGANPPRP